MASASASQGVDASAHISNPYMAFTMSLQLAYHQASLAPDPKASRPRAYHTRAPVAPPPPMPARRKPAAPRAPSCAKKSDPSAHQLPDLPTAVACDATQKRLSTEAQLIQDRARKSRNDRLSNLSDRESLLCLEAFPLHITCRPSLSEASDSPKRYTPPILPKYFPPPPPRKSASPRVGRNGQQTVQPPISIGEPLKAIREDGNSFSDDSDVSEDDVFFEKRGLQVGHRLPVEGISLFAHLQDIRVKEARGSRSSFSGSSSMPGELSDGNTIRSVGDIDEDPASAQYQSVVDDEYEDWEHVEQSAILTRRIAESEMWDDQVGATSASVEDEVDQHITSLSGGILSGSRYQSTCGGGEETGEGDELDEDDDGGDELDKAWKLHLTIAYPFLPGTMPQEEQDDDADPNHQILFRSQDGSEEVAIERDENEEDADGWLEVDVSRLPPDESFSDDY
ncbi:uncharacterized protein RCC_11265 [Ramularia collo-cygni]|uniref:Uncharacterized protein n=1 Tax=Ramularia collo-cygni TaxID=112498 RepID=A0A2D3VJ96_9PEZI|nr:uncharacterized protein RCC_11265 [Ramularia collo-cygni]CZT25532.1 uncharacterized protein RCC_11265 [Ramularia collo-cygni]